LQEYHGPSINLSQNRNFLSLTCRNGTVDEFDLTLKAWTIATGQYQLPYIDWPQKLEPAFHTHRERIRVNGVCGTLIKSSQEPVFGMFHPDEAPLASQTIYKVTERSLWGALRGKEQFFNDKGKIVTLEVL
jgi:hypothetical protein